MTDYHPELEEKLQELEHELEVGYMAKVYIYITMLDGVACLPAL